jgi:hypothetical protein
MELLEIKEYYEGSYLVKIAVIILVDRLHSIFNCIIGIQLFI